MIDDSAHFIFQKTTWSLSALRWKNCHKKQKMLMVETDNKQTPTRHLSCVIMSFNRVALLLFVAFFLYGCGGRPIAPVYEPTDRTSYPEPDAPEVKVIPTSPKADMLSGPAAPLHVKAQSLLAKNEYRQAELAMERALRVEPKNGYYWHTLAKIAFSQNEYGRTVQLCLKSKSLARGDERLIQLNDYLIGKSK